MSFSFSIPATKVADFEKAANKAAEDYQKGLEANDYQLDDAAQSSIQAAIDCAMDLVSSGIVGSGTVTANISGHANPDHKPVSGWANDSVTVAVYCADQYQEPPANAAASKVTTKAN